VKPHPGLCLELCETHLCELASSSQFLPGHFLCDQFSRACLNLFCAVFKFSPSNLFLRVFMVAFLCKLIRKSLDLTTNYIEAALSFRYERKFGRLLWGV